MDFNYFLTLFCIINIHFFEAFASDSHVKNSFKTYIVHVESPDEQIFTNSEDLDNWYNSFLPPTINSNEEPRMVYSYHNAIKGFAAKLSLEEVKEMEKKQGFVVAYPEKELSLHTTHSPDFLGLHQSVGLWRDSNLGKGVIIGMIDGGIYSNHPSFSDIGVPPPPDKWKGICDSNVTACNNKLIGARFFTNYSVNVETHATHTSSIAAGNFVEGANIFGNANGTASGTAPLAHLAIYRVCANGTSCFDSDILAGIDAAIEDGVDILSISLGGLSRSFYTDSIAISAYSAMERGIFVSCSAGNDGPFYRLLSNNAPWVLSVGASTIDRKLNVKTILGNNEEIDGQSAFYPKDFPNTTLPLIYAGWNKSDPDSRGCSPETLKKTDVKGKIVLCERDEILSRVKRGQAVKDAGGVAMIFMNTEPEEYTTFASNDVLPATQINFVDGERIKAYINSTKSPIATMLFQGTVIGDFEAPSVAVFSSRGPNIASPGILKPDIIGPGVNILAAWPVSIEKDTNTKSTFNIMSGTSMACPHLSGIAALIKSMHPDWSPAAIKSAIMTTADQTNLGNKPILDEYQLKVADIFAIGAGHVNPSRANNPGLIYDIQPTDYLPYLCGLNYTNQQVGLFLKRVVNCSEVLIIPDSQLNYPSFSIRFESTPQTYTRTVTNVGDDISTYNVEIVSPAGVDVSVEPTSLVFSKLNQKLTYKITFSPSAVGVTANFSQGYLKWYTDKYSVRSPIGIIFSLFF